ncbi:21208_t:CDS:2 [Cetraspora pellucida]|uniref:Rhomboid-type serine protease n=1 Tax=Cetraspora pellucida TaxID=1433469 RepID=A0A9N8WTQ1_9GLOM|nr:21208_t:CDS:2 [Cetraspora pellucida]
MSKQSGWNQYYHQGQGYDTRGAGVEEKGVSPSDPSFWASSDSRLNTAPSAPPASVIDFEDTQHETHRNKEALETESDEDYARRLYREDREELDKQRNRQYGQYGDGVYHNTSGEPGGYDTSGQIEQGSRIPSVPQNQPQAKPRPWNRAYFTYVATAPFSSNPMIGPGPETLVQLGARFVPCMREVSSVTASTPLQCPTSTGGNTICYLEAYCGLGGFHGGGPNQWFRFITPIFLHAGVIHFLFNMLFQLTTGRQVENEIGWWRYGIIYMASGIFGFIFGGSFSGPLIPSMGASGSLFGIVGVLLVDLLQNWKIIPSPCWELTKLLLIIIFSFLLGLLPSIDNFSHIGGFLMGLVTGLALNPTYNFSKIHKYANVILRIIALVCSALLFLLLTQNFYSGDPNEKCPWCKYLSCLPATGWCADKIGNSTIGS